MGAFLSGYCYYVLLRAIPIDLFFFSSFLGMSIVINKTTSCCLSSRSLAPSGNGRADTEAITLPEPAELVRKPANVCSDRPMILSCISDGPEAVQSSEHLSCKHQLVFDGFKVQRFQKHTPSHQPLLIRNWDLFVCACIVYPL
ncbi:hypothetical protein SEVIR_2G428651v4 [Setaria viridis]|nr:uncharacterized protein LOC117846348 [Setaria viridis]